MTGFEHLCMNCMSDTEGKSQCPHCGFSEDEPQPKDALPYRSILQDRYMIGCVKFSNSEGFTYIGFDMQKLSPVQIREFFPQEICARITDSSDIAVIAGNELAFDEYLNNFVTYQEAVAKFRDQPAILTVSDIFEENYTAYAISPWEESITLRYFVERSGGSLSWNAAWKLFMPVITAASAMYASGVGHYGISPDTLFIMQDGSMKLESFCSAAVRTADGGLQPDVVPGCAAAEQYDDNGKTNEYTDVYGMAASLFFVLTGVLPKAAPDRRKDPRLLLPSSTLRSIPPHVITALANALQVEPEGRTATFERFRAELSAAPTPTASLEETQNLRRIPSPYDDSVDREERAHREDEEENEGHSKSIPKFVWIVLICVAALVCLTVGIELYRSGHPQANNTRNALSVASSVSAGSGVSGASGGAASGAAGTASGASGNAAGQQTTAASGKTASSAQSALSSTASLAHSADSNQISVPNLLGKRFSSLGNTSDYQVVQTGKEFSDSIEEGCIISQTPPASSGKMVKGSAISVTVSQGKALRTLPGIAGKSYEDAKSAVASAGFVPDGKQQQYSDSVAKGAVIGYGDGLTAGSKLNYQYSVTIVISAGPKSTDDNTDDNDAG
ncbi:MAG: PASTA domain-containing protein [Oscillospiraceae bacterium]|jgi:serine/threonine-protein kinase|nr:PASTA domain-containing protein [Oscillospiraceae bacterium]